MNSSDRNHGLNTQIYEEACEWLVHFRAGDADNDVAARRELDEWLRRSPEHVRAYLEVSALWEDVAFHDAERKINAEVHLARARSEVNVVALELRGAAAPISPPRDAPPRRLPAWTVAATIAVLTIGGVVGTSMLRAPTYSTSIGEQRSLILDDGSTLELNARSRIRVRYTEAHRVVELLDGQALFRVAKDPNRPFLVYANNTRVRAVGTQFDVNRRKSTTTVTVIEGRVSVDDPLHRRMPKLQLPTFDPNSLTGPSGEVLLDAGQQITVAPAIQAAPKPKVANVDAAIAWTQHRLVFDSAPLSEVVEEFNRYNKRPIVIRDPALESFGVIGVFSSTAPASLLKFLSAQPEIEVTEGNSEIVISRE